MEPMEPPLDPPLAFTSCRRYLKYVTGSPQDSVYAALHLQSTLYAELVNCSFHDNPLTVLIVYNTIITLAGNTEIKHISRIARKCYHCF